MIQQAALALMQPLERLMPRMLPRLVIIGAQKAGTTTLYDLLAQHPRIIQPRVKEISFFSSEKAYARGMDHYRSFLPPAPLFARGCITFDASPMYLYHPQAAERIARHLPGALCLALLRDPVERAYSAWNMYHQFKDDPRHGWLYDERPFETAVEDELAGKAIDPARRYLDRGLYMPQLERYLAHVGPQRLMVRGFDELRNDPAGLVNAVLERLGLRPFPAGHPAFTMRSNARAYAASMPDALRRRLRLFYSDDARSLREAFGIDVFATAD